MTAAFQSNAFQNDAFQVAVAPAHISMGGGFAGPFPKRTVHVWSEANLRVEWTIYAETKADLHDEFITRRFAEAALPQRWATRHFVDGGVSPAWTVTAIDRVAEWNRQILLGEIDEDLMFIRGRR